MVNYNIFLRKSAEKELASIPRKDLVKVIERIQSLAEDPRPAGSKKLSAKEQYRVRQGDYRIVYAVNDPGREIRIVKIGHRREVYR